MGILEIALPASLLALAFLLKLLIDRTATLPYFIQAILELPVDIAFLATSFIVAFTISTPEMVKEGLFAFAIYIICSVIVVLLWRRSVRLFESEYLKTSFALATVNYMICITGLVLGVAFVTGGVV